VATEFRKSSAGASAMNIAGSCPEAIRDPLM
jgi:hypothetical protein